MLQVLARGAALDPIAFRPDREWINVCLQDGADVWGAVSLGEL
jgi:hypothetical protein